MGFLIAGLLAGPSPAGGAVASPPPVPRYTHIRALGPATLSPVRPGASKAAPVPFLRPAATPASPAVTARPPQVRSAGIRIAAGRTAAPTRQGTLQASPSIPVMSEAQQVTLFGADQQLAPPDTQLAAGQNELVEAVNASLSIWTKAGALVPPAYDLNAFFSVPAGSRFVDPRILYDALSGRWFLSGFSFDTASGNSRVYLAVSSSADPTAAWYKYLVTSTTNGTLTDQPFLGLNSDKVVLSWNDGTLSSGTVTAEETWVVQKSDLLNNAPTPATAAFPPDTSKLRIVPAQSLSSTTTEWLVYNRNFCPVAPCPLGLGAVALTGTPAQANVAWNEYHVPIAATAQPPAAPEPGGFTIDTDDSRFLSATWQNGVLWTGGDDGCTPPGDTQTRACMRLVQLSAPAALGPPSAIQDFDVGQAGLYLAYPAVALDPAGDLVAAFTLSGPNTYPTVAALDQPAATPGTIDSASIAPGTASYNCGSSPGRWGDYSAAAVDPASGQVWSTGEYQTDAAAGCDWATATAAVTVSTGPFACHGSTGSPSGQPTVLGGRPYTGGSDAVGVAQGSTNAYFAEGYTGPGFQEYLTVQNPGAAQTLCVDYLLQTGKVIVKPYSLAAGSRTTIDVDGDVGGGQNVSAHLYAQSPFIAERPMYFDYNNSITGGDDVMGAQSLGTTFYFAEGYTGPGFSEYLTLMNPNSSAVTVNVTYFFPSRAPKVVPHTIPATSRATIFVNDPAEAGPNQNVSMQVQSTKGSGAFLAERPMYFDYKGKWTGGHVAVGAAALSQSLNLAEGHVGDGFDEYLTLFNPGIADAHTTITYYLRSGAPVPRTMTVPARTRQTVFVNGVLAAGSDDSVNVSSDQPIMVERPMYFDYKNKWTGGHDAVAVDSSQLASTIYFAEGYVAPNFDEYLTVENPNSAQVGVTFTYLLTNGTTKSAFKVVQPRSRFTELVNADLPSGTPSSVEISASGGNILVERPMYFAY